MSPFKVITALDFTCGYSRTKDNRAIVIYRAVSIDFTCVTIGTVKFLHSLDSGEWWRIGNESSNLLWA